MPIFSNGFRVLSRYFGACQNAVLFYMSCNSDFCVGGKFRFYVLYFTTFSPFKMGEGCTADDCMKRWKTLRDRFVRELKKTRNGKSGDAGPVVVSTWPLFNVMNFIGDSVKHKR